MLMSGGGHGARRAAEQKRQRLDLHERYCRSSEEGFIGLPVYLRRTPESPVGPPSPLVISPFPC